MKREERHKGQLLREHRGFLNLGGERGAKRLREEGGQNGHFKTHIDNIHEL